MDTRIIAEVAKLAESINSLALTVERISGRVTNTEQDIAALRAQPAAVRSWAGIIIAATSGCLIPTILAAGSLVAGAFGTVVTILLWALSHH